MTTATKPYIPEHMVHRCSTCKARIVWLRHCDTAKAAPVDVEPDDKIGSLVIDIGRGTYRYVPTGDRAYCQEDLHTNHFATCPYADQHRPKGSRQTPNI